MGSSQAIVMTSQKSEGYESPRLAEVSAMNIVVVDDIVSWRQFISTMLQKEQSFAVVGEVSGVEAVETARKLRPAIVVLEINLRDGGGLAIGEQILDILPDTKLIYLSSEFDHDIVRIAFRLGAFAYVLKSDAVGDLVSAIHAAARNETFVSTQLQGHGFLDTI